MTIFNNIFEFIQSTMWMQIILFSITVILCITLISKFFKLINSIIKLINSKATQHELENDAFINSSNTPTLSIYDRIDVTNKLFDLISFMISNEIYRVFKDYQMLKEPYIINNIDDDLKKICETVFSGIKKEVYSDPDLLIEDSYIIEYLTKRATVMMFDMMLTYNLTLNKSESSADDT